MLFVAIDIYLAAISWQEIRGTIGWVKNIPQSTNFKIRHIVQYAPQTFILAIFLQLDLKNIKSTVKYATIIVTIVGVLSEAIQYFIPSRIPSFLDVFWNTFAAVLGGLLFYLWETKIKTKSSHP